MQISTVQDYTFKYTASKNIGFAIMKDDEVIGGVYYKTESPLPSFNFIFVDSIEILPAYRNKGYASEIIKRLTDENMFVTGNVNVFGPIGFWKKHGATFYSMFSEDETGDQYLSFMLNRESEPVKIFMKGVKEKAKAF